VGPQSNRGELNFRACRLSDGNPPAPHVRRCCLRHCEQKSNDIGSDCQCDRNGIVEGYDGSSEVDGKYNQADFP
jgi:hypothetical protein